MGGTRVFVGVHRGTVVSCVLVRSEGRSMEDAVGGIGRSHTILFALFFQALEACRLSLYAGSVRALVAAVLLWRVASAAASIHAAGAVHRSRLYL